MTALVLPMRIGLSLDAGTSAALSRRSSDRAVKTANDNRYRICIGDGLIALDPTLRSPQGFIWHEGPPATQTRAVRRRVAFSFARSSRRVPLLTVGFEGSILVIRPRTPRFGDRLLRSTARVAGCLTCCFVT